MTRRPRVEQAPILVARWELAVKYLLLAAVGLAAGWRGSETLSMASSDDGVRLWALLFTFAALVCAISSLRMQWEPVETWASVPCFALLASFAASAFSRADGDHGATAFAFILLALCWIPGVRMTHLLSRLGLRTWSKRAAKRDER